MYERYVSELFRLKRCRHHQGIMNMIYENDHVILAVDSSMQGNDWIWLPKASLIHLRASLWEEGIQSCKLLWAATLHKLALQLGEYHLLSLVFRPALLISTPLQPLLNVNSGKQRFPDGGPSMISGFIELTANCFGRNCTIQMLIQQSSHIGGSSRMLSFHNAL